MSRITFLSIFFLTILNSGFSQILPQEVVNGFHYRAIGPTRQSGRFVDFAVVENSPKVFYAATASGHLWKTVNNGISFFPLFENESVFSIGDVTVAPSDSSIVWVGSGEANNSRSSYWGDG
ncbi:MAG: glycosyl hydrolase, partial [Cyclobacteriaceae bacterium]|nr:glycosyl hydrolase [Cyclobacteriaceae bacterium]